MRRLLPTLTVLCLGLSVGPASPALASTHKHKAAKTVHKVSHDGPAHTATIWTSLTDALTQVKPTVTRTVKATHVAKPAAPMSKQGVKLFGSKVLKAAAKKAGSPYVYGAAGPTVFDCSGYTRFIYGELGVSLPHSSYAQYAMTEHLSVKDARPGDLVFMRGLGHVGIYAGDGMMWDAPTTGGHVSKRAIYGAFTIGRVVRHG